MRKIQCAVLVIFFCAGLGSASAQTPVYKCANQYSDTPCPQAVAVKADDARSSTQQSQANAATKRVFTFFTPSPVLAPSIKVL